MITAKEHRIIAENGAYAKYAPAVTNLGTYRIYGLYRINNIRNECTLTPQIGHRRPPSGGSEIHKPPLPSKA